MMVVLELVAELLAALGVAIVAVQGGIISHMPRQLVEWIDFVVVFVVLCWGGMLGRFLFACYLSALL